MAPPKSTTLLLALITLTSTTVTALALKRPPSDGSCGANIDLSPWALQLPVGEQGHPETLSPEDLKQCSPGSKTSEYFSADQSDGSVIMKVPKSPDETDCVTTMHSKHCRTEFRESDPKAWDPEAGKNRLRAELAVVKADDSEHGTVIGQVHIDDEVSSKPVCELFYNKDGEVSMGVERTRDGGNLQYTKIGSVPVGKKFKYEIRYEGGKLGVSLNDGGLKDLDTYELDSPRSYFKAGNYNQGDSESEVRFYGLTVEH